MELVSDNTNSKNLNPFVIPYKRCESSRLRWTNSYPHICPHVLYGWAIIWFRRTHQKESMQTTVSNVSSSNDCVTLLFNEFCTDRTCRPHIFGWILSKMHQRNSWISKHVEIKLGDLFITLNHINSKQNFMLCLRETYILANIRKHAKMQLVAKDNKW